MQVLDENALSLHQTAIYENPHREEKKESWYELCCLAIHHQTSLYKNVLLLIGLMEYVQLLAITFLASAVYFFKRTHSIGSILEWRI